MAIRGIDVASYQSETPDLSGMDFVFVKATEGTSYINPKMRAQADHARAAGRVVGFYHFLRPGSMRAQAAYFVRKCASLPGDPLWADWEDPDVSCADKDDFLREVVRLRGDTHRVGLYCNTNFWLHRDTTSYCADALWIAVYNGRPGRPGIRHKWLFHQYTSSPIDTSVSTFTSRAALRAWCTEGRAHISTNTKEAALVADKNDVKTLYKTDGVLDSPDKDNDPKGNRYWTAESYHRYGYLQDRETNHMVKTLTAQIASLSAALAKAAEGGGLTADQVQEAAEAGARAALAELGETLTDQEA